MVEQLLSVCEALELIPGTNKGGKGERERRRKEKN